MVSLDYPQLEELIVIDWNRDEDSDDHGIMVITLSDLAMTKAAFDGFVRPLIEHFGNWVWNQNSLLYELTLTIYPWLNYTDVGNFITDAIIWYEDQHLAAAQIEFNTRLDSVRTFINALSSTP